MYAVILLKCRLTFEDVNNNNNSLPSHPKILAIFFLTGHDTDKKIIK